MKKAKPDIINTTDKQIRIAIGSKIKEIRNRNHLSGETVAKSIGLSRVSLTQAENGKNNVTAVTLWKLACRLNCKIQDFFPALASGYGLSRGDIANIEKEDDQAVEWAEKLFTKK